MIPQLLGLGAVGLEAEIDGFLLQSPNPTSTQVAEFLRLYERGAKRNEVAQALIARGVSANAISAALTWLDASGKINWQKVWSVAAVASAAASGYHGYRRNQSIGWAAWWFVMGGIFPIFTPIVATAQGFGKKKA